MGVIEDIWEKLQEISPDLVIPSLATSSIDLYGSRVGDQGTLLLANCLADNPQEVRKVYLADSRVSDEGAVALAEALKVNTHLHALFLNQNSITESGAVALASALQQNNTLRILALDDNRIGTLGAKSLEMMLRKNRTLRELWLDGNPISDAVMTRLTLFLDSRHAPIPGSTVGSTTSSPQLSQSLPRGSPGTQMRIPVSLPLRSPHRSPPSDAARTGSTESPPGQHSGIIDHDSDSDTSDTSSSEDGDSVSEFQSSLPVQPASPYRRYKGSPTVQMKRTSDSQDSGFAPPRSPASHFGSKSPQPPQRRDSAREPETSNFREIEPDDLQIGPLLASGSFGKVHKGRWLGTDVAIKFLYYNPGARRKLSEQPADASVSGSGREASSGPMSFPHDAIGDASQDDTLLDEFRKEVQVLSNLRHPHIVLMLGACSHAHDLAIVTEYLSRGSLSDHIERSRENGEPLSLEFCHRVATHIATGMNYLHNTFPIVIHRDLRSANIFLDEDGKAKVGDFGLARTKVFKGLAQMTGGIGTPGYMAPEVLQNDSYSEKADVYSYGMILLEMCASDLLAAKQKDFHLFVSLAQNPDTRPHIPAQVTPAWASLIRKCWATDPSTRPSFTEILEELSTYSRRFKQASHFQ